MITLSAKQYIESQNIRVFPCAYRGYYNADKTLVFDPEARATTEANFTNTFHKLSDNKESYVIAWAPDSATDIDGTGTLKCVIGGYYFEIYNHRMSNFFYHDPKDASKLKPYYLCIKTESISLGTSEPDSTNARTTKVLSSFAESTNYLDIKNTQGRYAFTGLLVSKTADANGSATASLAPFIAIPKGTKDYEYKLDPSKLPITNLLDVGSGNYSIRMVEDDTEQGSNTTIASGNYSVAFGLKTAATGEASTTLGNNTKASGKGAFAAGNNTNASGEGAAALGSNTKAEADNQVVIGAYNEKDDNQAFIIANGTADDNRSNKFTVSKNGDVKALGTLETKGSIKAAGDSNNDLELGTPAAGSSGSIKVYGTGDAEAVFTVENTGKTTISGDTTISGITTIANTKESTSTSEGALKVTGGVGVAKNLNVGGRAEIAENLNVGGEFSVAADKATTLGGSLTTKGDTTLEDSTTLKDTLTVEKLATLKAGAKITGTVEINGKATSAETTAEDTNTTLTTKSYVDETIDEAKNAAVSYTDTKLKAIDFGSDEIATVKKPNGEYLQTVTQVDGKIAATKANFATTFDPIDNLNAPTSSAIHTHIITVIKALYPIGSIYMQYIAPEAAPPEKGECPLKAILTDSEWELIKNGRFLRSVGAADYARGNEGGSENTVLIKHTHKYTLMAKGEDGLDYGITYENGNHTHGIAATSAGTGPFTGFDGQRGDDTSNILNVSTAGAHQHYLPNIMAVTETDVAEGTRISDDGRGTNLPPYLNVYMWKRIK